MRWRLPLPSKQLNRQIYLCVAALFSLPATSFAQSCSTPPIPIWSGEWSVPAGYGNRKVFLSPDQHSLIILWPNPDGTETKRRFNLHNEIDPDLRIHIEDTPSGFRYTYHLKNGMKSKDPLTDFKLVIYPDPQTQAVGESWEGGVAMSTVKERIGIPGAPPGKFAHWSEPLV
jgi:hypothetical protein